MSWDATMRRALELAAAGRYGASPNPLVGAVVLDADGRLAGEGAHRRCGGPHAEIEALAAAGELARGGTLVVTLEPCAHQGRTPPCVDTIVASGIRRVVTGTRDPNPRVDGRGVAALTAAGIEVVEGVEAEACRAANPRYFHWARTGRPFVALKVAMSVDGKIATRGGHARWITCEAARREGHALREEYDALLVGIGTVLADDPQLRRRLGLNPSPGLRRLVLDSTLRTPPGAALLGERPQDVVIFCRQAETGRRRALEATGAAVIEEPPFVTAAPWEPPTRDDLRCLPLVVKTPSNCYRLDALRALFPSARFRLIHLVRNAASSVNSWRSAKSASASARLGGFCRQAHQSLASHSGQNTSGVRSLSARLFDPFIPH
jgi:diaminohydroxyphosphoribosylaminopyrimidine deaminase/5-amino-6-(5-phosphoribosylamino)uracil reductase